MKRLFENHWPLLLTVICLVIIAIGILGCSTTQKVMKTLQCMEDTMVIVVIPTLHGPLPMESKIGCRCFFQYGGTALINTIPLDDEKCRGKQYDTGEAIHHGVGLKPEFSK